MKISVRQEVLAEGLQTVQRTSVARSPMQVLTGILFEARDGALTLSATDLETSVRLTAPAAVESEGSLVLPARVIVELVKRAPSEEIEIESAGDSARATVRFGRSLFKINGFPSEQFPQVPEEIGPDARAMPGALLRDAIGATTFAVSANEMRPVLTGVNLRWSESRLHAVATDGFRVAHFSGEAGEAPEEPVEVVLPARAGQELARLAGEGEDPLRIALSDNHLLARANGVLFQSSLLTGQFPAVLDMMPKEYPTEVTADLAGLTEALERVALVAASPEQSNAVRIRIADGQASLSAESVEVGDGEETIPVEMRGEPLQIAFNSRYLLDGLRHVSGEAAHLSFSGAVSAARITGGDERFEYWVLPLRIS